MRQYIILVAIGSTAGAIAGATVSIIHSLIKGASA